MIRCVIDASVVLKWYLPDEKHTTEAQRVLERYLAGELSLLAPTILAYEVLNALLVAERMARIPESVTETAYSGFLDLQIHFPDLLENALPTLGMARAYNRSAYDASYLSTAERHGADFITADLRLFNAVKDHLKWVKNG